MNRLEVPQLTLVRCRKVCRKCGRDWHGNFFAEWAPKAERRAMGDGKEAIVSECDDCIEKWERRRALDELAIEVGAVDAALKGANTTGKQHVLLRHKVWLLKKMRTWHDVGSRDWTALNERIAKIENLGLAA